MTNASVGFLIALAILDYVFFYIALNFKEKELQVLFFSLGIAMMSVVFMVCGLIAQDQGLIAIESLFNSLVRINVMIFFLVFAIFFILLIKRAIDFYKDMIEGRAVGDE